MNQNLILLTDSYKLTHHRMYPKDVEVVSSYFEPRVGPGHQEVVWFGLQHVLKDKMTGFFRVIAEDIDEAEEYAKAHFAAPLFNREGWERIVDTHQGALPIRIWALPEGTVVPRGTPCMVIENTDPQLPWLTNALESLLMHVWYPTTIATIGRDMRRFFQQEVPHGAPQFMLHDFGYRGVSSDESAGVGGMAHLLHFQGTDTLNGMWYAHRYYDAPHEGLAYSVAATEHSVMTQWGAQGETALLERLIDDHPNQILSIVADSYDYYNFVAKLSMLTGKARANGTKLVIRPDSPTPQHPDPKDLVLWTLNHLPDDVNVLWGDGLSPDQIKAMVLAVPQQQRARLVFGMGGGLLQKVNRDTLRCATKCSAVQTLGGEWKSIQKNPLDQSKASKAGRQITPKMQLVFENGILLVDEDFATIRVRCLKDIV